MALPRPAPGQGRWWFVGIVAGLLACGAAVWFGISATRGLSWSDAGFDNPVPNNRITMRFDVVNQDGRPVRCTLKAMDIRHAQVGITTVDLPASSYQSTRYQRTIPTVAQAVTGTVVNCEYK
ncbi:DUF4307 domain-containing protein [Calidifontibacter sp. DB0510]|uniref:DUF4307 domain-containing protein n=1 Tax=Metallococcus carri TaxID=1656884 RepID=A0A967EAW7_9MICO|nr:DUF4307 domain-containing protein [Metallococcus carri]NHN56670.1 DUF4307 domain-containing protein [Metallococcus carri]NOP38969.1 DUF4307 domain-containing protein [Calidifontibacter sp. DB2511S]